MSNRIRIAVHLVKLSQGRLFIVIISEQPFPHRCMLNHRCVLALWSKPRQEFFEVYDHVEF